MIIVVLFVAFACLACGSDKTSDEDPTLEAGYNEGYDAGYEAGFRDGVEKTVEDIPDHGSVSFDDDTYDVIKEMFDNNLDDPSLLSDILFERSHIDYYPDLEP